MYCRRSLFPSKSSLQTLPLPAETILISLTGQHSMFLRAPAARVGTVQMDSNGRAQATLLPNTAYYLVETTAPAGYIPLHDRIAFTTTDNGGYVTIDEQPGTITLRIVKLDAATNAGPKLGLRSQEQNSCAYRNQPLDGHKLSGPMKAVKLPSPMSPGNLYHL